MPPMAIEDIRRKLETDTRPAMLTRLEAKAAEAGNAGAKVRAKFVSAEQSVAEGSREVVAAISAETPDEDGDVILLAGWDLSYFRKHPVVMGFHDYFDYPTGKGLWVKKDKSSGRLLAKTRYAERPPEFPREQEWRPDTILWLRQNDYMRGYSVGFVLLEDREPTAKEVKDHPEWEGKRIIARAKLLEYSDVPLPCNADAAQIMVAKGLLPKPEAEDDEADTTATDDTAGPAADAGELGGERGVPADPDGDTARDADDAGSTRDGLVDAGGDAGAVLGATSVADPDGVERKFLHPVLQREFDVPDAPSEPANRYLGMLSEFLKTEVKSIFCTRHVALHAEMGNYLNALKQTTAEHRELDVRNIAEDGREYPPLHEVIQLNSRQSDSFLVHGMSFRTTSHFRYAVECEVGWRGLIVSIYGKWEDRSGLLDIMDEAARHAEQNHVLRGEAFALSGVILQRKDVSWDELFLRREVKTPIMRAATVLERKGPMAPSRGIILMGPPGTGKTLAGRILMNQAKVTFIWLSAKDFYRCGAFGGLSMGFHLARKLAPSILFVEDVDNWLHDREVDMLKTEMDGIEQYSGVLTILTTNYPERLPEAIIDRPGRFDDVLSIDLPDAKMRAAMLKAWIEGVAPATITAVTERTKGYSGAHIKELVKYAGAIGEERGLDVGAALLAAIEKVEQQRERINDLHSGDSDHRPSKMLQGMVRALTIKGKEAETRIAGALLESGAAETSDEELDALPVASAITKPGFEETDNEIRYRVRQPSQFQPGSFRRVTLQRTTPKVYAIIGRLKGEQGTSIQALRFPKDAPDNWTIPKARQWVKDHSDALKGAKESGMRSVGPTPAETAHLQVLHEIAAGKYVKIDQEAIDKAALEKAVEEQLAYHRGHLG